MEVAACKGCGLLKLLLSELSCHSSCCAGNIASWKKKEGDAVGAGDEMAEIETDKVPSRICFPVQMCLTSVGWASQQIIHSLHLYAQTSTGSCRPLRQ